MTATKIIVDSDFSTDVGDAGALAAACIASASRSTTTRHARPLSSARSARRFTMR